MAEIQAYFDKLMALAKEKTLWGIQQMRLGELIDALEEQTPSTRVLLQFGDRLFAYGELCSYRGYYTDLCIEPGGPVEVAGCVASLRNDLIMAVNKTYFGYKGGEYLMTRDTPLWVDHHGNCDGYAVTGVRCVEADEGTGTPAAVIVETTYVE